MPCVGNTDHGANGKTGEAETESILQGLPLHEHDPAQYYPPVFGSLRDIGSVEISKDATVEALKEMILTLPAVGPGRKGSVYTVYLYMSCGRWWCENMYILSSHILSWCIFAVHIENITISLPV